VWTTTKPHSIAETEMNKQIHSNTRSVVTALMTLVVTVTVASITARAEDKPSVQGHLEARERTKTVHVKATVTAIDHQTRKVTLMGADGEEVTLIASDAVKRFNEIQKGDEIKVAYTISFLVEHREATEAEKQEPLAVVGALARGDPSGPAAGAGVRLIKAVTKVVTLDKVNKSITVQGPLGGLLTAPVRDLKALETLKIGDTLVLTYAEGVAVELEKVKP
jgi:hypothetical protein